MSRTRRFLGGVGFGYVSLVLATVVGLWLTPFLLHRIGSYEYGLWLITTQLLGYLMLLDLGVVALAPRETAYAMGMASQGGADDVGPTFARFRRIVKWQLAPTAVASVLAWWLVGNRWPELRVPLAIILGAFVAAFPLRLYHATLQGLQDLPFLGKAQLAAYIAGTLTTVGFVIAGVGLPALAAGWVVTQAVSAAACAWRLAVSFTPVWRATADAPSLADARVLFGRSGWVSLSQVGQVFLNGSDLLVLGGILGPAATVPYACTGKLITVLANHPQLLMQAAAPAIAEMRASAQRAHLARVSVALMRAMLILSGAVACLVAAANQSFVEWWVGPNQFAGMTLTVLLLASMLARHFATTLGYSLFSFGYERRLALTSIADGIVAVVVTAALAWWTGLGVLSAAIGSLAGVTLVSIPASGLALARELQITVPTLILSLRTWALRFAAALVLSVILSRVIGVNGLGGLIAIAMSVAVIYGIIMWPLLMEPPLSPYVRAALVPVARMFGVRQEAVEPRA